MCFPYSAVEYIHTYSSSYYNAESFRSVQVSIDSKSKSVREGIFKDDARHEQLLWRRTIGSLDGQ